MSATRPLRIRLPDGQEYAFHGDADEVERRYPGAVILRYEDGAPYEPPKREKPAKAAKEPDDGER